MDFISGYFNYYACAALFCTALFIILVSANRIKQLFGLGLMQSSVMLLFISLGKVSGGNAPITSLNALAYANPLPHVLMLTAIVVGLATLAVGLSLAIRIKKQGNDNGVH